MWEELQNALEWYGAAPNRWYSSAKKDLSAAAEWIWTVIQGDFAEEQSTAQTITGTVISMIPFVDQICDVRDVVANCKKINEDKNNKWHWVALILTLIGLFPTVGSLLKGCFKVLFAYGRKAMHGAGKVALDADLWKACVPYVEAGITKLNAYVRRPEVRKAMAALKIDNIYKHMADELRKVSGKLNTGLLLKAMDSIIETLNKLLDLVKKWGSATMQTKAGALLKTVKGVRDQANAKLAEVLKPAQDFLNRLAQRLDVEHQLSRQATPNASNLHKFVGPDVHAEAAAFKRRKPNWVDVGASGSNPPLKSAPKPPKGHSDISAKAPKPLKEAFNTFHRVRADEIAPGETLYRVLDPNSADNSICWMTKTEFDQLKGIGDWRRRFAVWGNWNGNGEYVTYTVPKNGPPLKVWRGETASQQLTDRAGNVIKADNAGNSYWLEGGAEQLIIDPRQMSAAAFGKRKHTGWGYEGNGSAGSMIGVPLLTTNMRTYP